MAQLHHGLGHYRTHRDTAQNRCSSAPKIHRKAALNLEQTEAESWNGAGARVGTGLQGVAGNTKNKGKTWLGRQDSNLGMAESKSKKSPLSFNLYLNNRVISESRYFNGLRRLFKVCADSANLASGGL